MKISYLKGIQGVFPGDREEDELCRLSPFPDPPGQFWRSRLFYDEEV